VLAVQVYQESTELREHRCRGRAAVHPGPGAAAGLDFPPNDHPLILDVQPQLLDLGTHPGRGDFEHAFHYCPPGTGAHLLAVRPFAQQQRQRVHQHRLPCPGFAGKHVESVTKLQSHIGDRGKIPHPELDDHVDWARPERSPHWSFFRMRVRKPSGPSRMRCTSEGARRTMTRSPLESVVPTWPS
jgi:hypothetical protein